jgi:hypothetical protein
MGFINQAQYYEILRSIGVKINEELATKPEVKDETEEKPADSKDTEEPEDETVKKVKESKVGESWVVTRVRKPHIDS